MGVHVITFASAPYHASAMLLLHTALGTGQATTVRVYTEADVQEYYRSKPDLLQNSRGWGWWSWKPVIIRRALGRLEPSEYLMYVDACAMIQGPLPPSLPPNTDIALFGNGLRGMRNCEWTKPSVFKDMECSEAEKQAYQLNAAVQCYRNSPRAVAFLEDLENWCTSKVVVSDCPEFAKHRHDQSVLSILAARYSVPIYRDPSQYGVSAAVPGLDGDSGNCRDHLPLALLPSFLPPGTIAQHRQLYNLVKIAVITPTAGGPHLEACVASVQNQSLPNVEHWVVVTRQGPDTDARVSKIIDKYKSRKPIVKVVLPRATSFTNPTPPQQRVLGGVPWLVDAQYVVFLDDDKAIEPSHLAGLLRAVTQVPRDPGSNGAATQYKARSMLAWAHSLRKFQDGEGRRVDDLCESLGIVTPGLFNKEQEDGSPGLVLSRLVDLSSLLIRRDVAIAAAAAAELQSCRTGGGEGEGVWEAGSLGNYLLAHHGGEARVSHTHSLVCKGSTERLADVEKRNALLGYGWPYDFDKKNIYIFHFNPSATERFLQTRRDTSRSYALDEWQPTLLRGLDTEFNLLNGYACMSFIPTEATVLATLCFPKDLPLDFLKVHKGKRIVYTAESPNIRHADQWEATTFIADHFDNVLSYWPGLLDALPPNTRGTFCFHNSHHLDLRTPGHPDAALLRHPRPATLPKSCCMVLENRQNRGEYTVNNVALQSLDYMREAFVKGMREITVYGVGWECLRDHQPGITIGHTLHRSMDPKTSVDHMHNHDFVLIIENCDAENYASEKFYDALIAGCIPIYWGNLPPSLDVPYDIWIDMKQFSSGNQVQGFIDRLSLQDVQAYKDRIVEARGFLLEKVGVHSFAAVVKSVLAS